MIKPQEQRYTQSCLPICLAMLCGVKMSKTQEGEILLKGLDKKSVNYAYGMLSEFTNKYKKQLNVFVENNVYAKSLKTFFRSNEHVVIENEKCDLLSIEKHLEKGPMIIYVDAKFLEYRSYVDHAPHFIVIESLEDRKVTIVDPWEGDRREIKFISLQKAINSLKTRFKYSPVMITS
ncbi:hypothetical protein HN958_00215 [Candidatus Falkowbacteria bacterium]|jgi:hypothetical protein|nr:hypothetical protein [Candidatus Falkowbacteria bacterium]MBT7006912.1 hypothetical protein [Candidatus Falkowbacteria bacterium]